MAQVRANQVGKEEARLLNSVVQLLKQRKRGIIFSKLDINSIQVRGYADAGFATNSDLTSQIAMLVLLMDNFGNANIIHYASWKIRRVVRSTLAAEVYVVSACHDYCLALAFDLSTMLERQIPVYLMTDAKSIFDTITKLSGVTEKRLMIDIVAVRQPYSSGEITNSGTSAQIKIWQTP